MPKKITDIDYRIALNIIKNDIMYIDPHENDILPSNQISAEKAIIKKESFNLLSSEAKELINVILNAPSEILDIVCTPKTKKITKRSIFNHLQKVFRSKFIAEQIIKEIERWVNQL